MGGLEGRKHTQIAWRWFSVFGVSSVELYVPLCKFNHQPATSDMEKRRLSHTRREVLGGILNWLVPPRIDIRLVHSRRRFIIRQRNETIVVDVVDDATYPPIA